MKNNLIPRLLMSIGALVYLLGIWRTCPLFSGKGYFLGVLVMGMFAILAHQRTMEEAPDDGFASLCRLVLLLSVGLLMVGAWFVPAGWVRRSSTWRPGLCAYTAFPRCPIKRWPHRLAQKDSSERP
jgi:uncharacterized membrane protein YiaA